MAHRLDAGEQKTFTIQSFLPIQPHQITPGIKILVVGVIKYSDLRGIQRTTGFYWQWDSTTKEFEEKQHRAYSFED